jgi:fatty-acyl-CoA synthase/long-chain acyl-CoA synthetase
MPEPFQPTLSSLLLRAIHRHGERIAIRQGDTSLTYAELDRRSEALAAFLASRGIARGQRVALHLRNSFEYLIADLAILKLAAVKVPLHELIAADELGWCLEHCGATAMISHASLPKPAQKNPGIAILRISVPDGSPAVANEVPWAEAIASVPEREACEARTDDSAIIMYTGGTTGTPKGVHHCQGRMAVNLLAHVVCGDIRSDEVMLVTTPLPHSSGFHAQACLLQGGQVVLADRFEARSFIDLVARHQATWTFAVPTMLYRLLDAIAPGGPSMASLRTILYGAAPMDRLRLRQALEVLGPVFIQIYGQTECPNLITTLTKEDHLDESLHGSCGRPVPFVDVRVVGNDGSPCGPGEIGEVQVSAPYLLTEYFRNDEATRSSLSDGWLKTSDLGYQTPEGYLFLVDRAKDMIISGGMNVYSVEVESALRAHASVREVAVVGVPDSDWGEAVVAVVVPAQDVEAGELLKFARGRLSAYKSPKRVVFVEQIPLTKYGKQDKKAMRVLLASQ